MAESIQKEDWERFCALGSVPQSIREVVLRSWLRSKDGARLQALQNAPSLEQEELHNVRFRNSRLRRAARVAIKRTGYMLEDSGAMLLLCDSEGIILDAAGDSRVLSLGEENHLHPGGRWEENAIGTNAIGTALHMAKPVSIAGVEHFCEAIQRWSCAAAPIRDPQSGQLLGAIDISAPSEENLRQGAAFSVSIALQIEEALRGRELQEHHLLIDRLLSRRGVQGDSVMLLDRHGQRIWSSPNFNHAEDVLAASTWRPRQALPGSDGDARALAEHMRQTLPEAGVDLIYDGEDALGLIVAFAGKPRKKLVAQAKNLPAIATTGEAMASLCAEAERIVQAGVPLLITGPTGSGKETLARALHEAGPQAGRPFEVMDCSLLEAEGLRGGPAAEGLMRLSEAGGTLILDEPVETLPSMQPLLAQALAHLVRHAAREVQLISLSSLPLPEQVAQGHLRADLHYRLSGAIVRLPALAERREDLPGLIKHFAALGGVVHGGGRLRFTNAAMLRLQAHDWPGNLRELQNMIQYLSATSFSQLIDVTDLPPAIARSPLSHREDTLRDRERADILNAVAETEGNMTETARRLGISRSTLYLKLDQYGVPRGKRH